MPKGIKKERGPLDAPRAIPVSQSVLYRTIKKACPFGVRLDGTPVEDGELGVSYSHRQILEMLKANAEARNANLDGRPPFDWTTDDVMRFLWSEVPSVGIWCEVYRAVNDYKQRIKDKKGSE